ncbi:MAG: V-type ATP synthase subunit A [Bradymonadales bacterium]|nr:V-type ATP synthase subunit A [Bradymonadales bacterium]
MNDGNSITGVVIGINGNMVTVEVTSGKPMQNEVVYVHCGQDRLKSEIIRIQGNIVNVQVFEDTKGIKVGEPVDFSGELLSVELAPGLMGMIYDGLQNPLRKLNNRDGFFLVRGQYLPAVDLEKKWLFHPKVKPGDTVRAGSWLGWVQELHYPHMIMAPLDLIGTAKVKEIQPEAEYTVQDTVAVIEDTKGRTQNIAMLQTWPVKKPIKAFTERIYPRELLATGIRIIDTMFPVGRGGTACIPGPFGAGKTVLQQLVSRYASVDVVIVVACGERAGEVVDTIYEFPRLVDPKTGGALMDRTIIICNTSSMPVAAREASVYTGITLAEYYRQMGRDVLLLADSTSRWAQALREMSGRLEEIPGEEAFPAYLESRVANLYERAGLVQLRSGDMGAITMIGTVSPAGGNFEEPVTQATLKVVGAFLGLSRKRSDERKYPAIDPLDSWSLYMEHLHDDLNAQLDPNWVEMVQQIARYLRESAEVGRMMTVVGEEGISIDDLVTYLKGEMFDAAYLQQNAFDAVDASSSIERQIKDLKLMHRAVVTSFEFDTKPKARQFFANLQDAFYQKNYCALGSDEYASYQARIEELLASGSPA